MQMAQATGIKTVPFALMKSDQNTIAYITKRIDRISSNHTDVKILAMEDFCQLEGKLTIDKYHSSYERCAKIISKFSSQDLLDQTEFYLRIVFSYIVGNSDMHLKNFSLIESSYKSNSYVLSQGYDMLPVNIILATDTEELALTLSGKKKYLHKKDFLIFADSIGLNNKSSQNLIKKVVSMKDIYLHMCRQSLLPDDLKLNLENLIIQRIMRLQ